MLSVSSTEPLDCQVCIPVEAEKVRDRIEGGMKEEPGGRKRITEEKIQQNCTRTKTFGQAPIIVHLVSLA